MQIKIEKELLNNDYHISFEMVQDGISEESFENIKRFGEPVCDFGSSVEEYDPDLGGVKEILRLNTNIRKIPSQLPYTRVFKKTQYRENTERFALAYIETVRGRLDESIGDFVSKTDDFSDTDEVLNY